MLPGKPAGAGQRVPPGRIDPTTPWARHAHGTPLSVKPPDSTLSASGRDRGVPRPPEVGSGAGPGGTAATARAADLVGPARSAVAATPTWTRGRGGDRSPSPDARHRRPRGRPSMRPASVVPRGHRPLTTSGMGDNGRGKTGTQVPGAVCLPLAYVVGRPGAPSASTLGGGRRRGQRNATGWPPRLWTDLWTTSLEPVEKPWRAGPGLGRQLWSPGGPCGARAADQPQCCAPGVERKYPGSPCSGGGAR